VLSFQTREQNGRDVLVAQAPKPLRLVNRALGHEVTFRLDKFVAKTPRQEFDVTRTGARACERGPADPSPPSGSPVEITFQPTAAADTDEALVWTVAKVYDAG
jgi:hypothetical protein